MIDSRIDFRKEIGNSFIIKKCSLDFHISSCLICGLHWDIRMDKNIGKIIIVKENNIMGTRLIDNEGFSYCEHWLKRIKITKDEMNKHFTKINKSKKHTKIIINPYI